MLGVGLGVPGIAAEGRVDSPLLGWAGFALGDDLQDALGVPVLVDNDVNTLAVAERLYGRGHDIADFVTVTVGSGIGLGIVIDGEVHRGARGGAGEFGHVCVDPDGPLCGCGNRGCLEALVGDAGLVARGRAAGILGADDGATC
jgi:predicted NBD/HSP70 family sugar kinase